MTQRISLRRTLALLALLLYPLILPRTTAQSPAYDIVITNGHILDGTGSPWFSGDVGIRAAKIVAIGNLTAAARARTIDAHGQVVARASSICSVSRNSQFS